MKLQFKNQAFQEAATAAVCDVFEGRPYHDPQCAYGRSGKGSIAANRPILILDERQKMEGRATNEMLPKFNPLIIRPAHMAPIRDDGKPLQKHIYGFLTTDSSGEKCFAKKLDNSAEVVVYAMLSGGFAIPTPLGSNNQDGQKDEKFRHYCLLPIA